MSQNKPLGFGIIGTGAIAGMHAAAIEACKDSHLVAVCSSSAERAKLAAEKFKVPADHELNAFLARKEIEVVCICTHSGQHLEPALAAAKAGKHILLEKPIEVSLDRADQLIQACEEAGVKLGVIFQNRLKPGYLKLKEAVRAGKIGRLLLGTAAINWYRDPAYYSTSSWKGTKEGDGGAALINQGVHTIDLLLDIMGDAETVYGQVKTMVHRIEGEDLGAALVNFKNGALGTITGGTSLYPGNPERLEIYGDKGNIILEAGKIVTWNVKGEEGNQKDGGNPGGSGASDPMAIDFKLHQGQVEDMVAAINDDRHPMVTGKDARRSLALILGIYDSSSTNRPFNLV
ncbi:Gfo/Idh/MocA family protein [Cyclobacterium plantarum]|uniref:Gfo/Idh/MocA family oxidoreductase n=1 Tax=Cyclobacterium plantarum TaxID=2716263 RepID=A0ABX0HA32_9BACT|nr:Gfo/Idh/MocA family oxidoreductase [Cyclobacterium plantarum]NHE57257.1 Gfo/Idh/MocA family oxidoreductase [Cyclobacterium plantarum]